jgi:hypothetical protein
VAKSGEVWRFVAIRRHPWRRSPVWSRLCGTLFSPLNQRVGCGDGGAGRRFAKSGGRPSAICDNESRVFAKCSTWNVARHFLIDDGWPASRGCFSAASSGLAGPFFLRRHEGAK